MMRLFTAIFLTSLLLSCGHKEPETTPWGTTIGEEQTDTLSPAKGLSLSEIMANGELIMLTINGPETYYDYHGKGMGLQYLLCERFAQHIGVSLRVELCRDTTEMVRRLTEGEGDLIAFPLPTSMRNAGLRFCGAGNDSTQWAVTADNTVLADTLNSWFQPGLLAKVREEEDFLLSSRSVRRQVFSPMLNRGKGIISKYDHLFKRYAPAARMDWRLMAAQCYQESCFDPHAQSWAGARGLMQIMPGTAELLGLPISSINDPESNVEAAARYMAQLQSKFYDVRDPSQRVLFALASYNGGYHHVRDAMALAAKHGRNPSRWDHVSEFILRLQSPAYYRDPVVKYGYMRGSETANYVERIRNRWANYRGVAGSSGGMGGGGFHGIPAKAKRKHKYQL